VKVMNALMVVVLRSPLHRVASKGLAVIRYTGRRSGKRFSLPAQYLRHDGEIVVYVGRPATKAWWRNFRDGADADVLVGGTWMPMSGRVVAGVDDEAAVTELRAAYLDRFPKAEKVVGDTPATETLFVRFTPRTG
jgi:hypothetical protein